MCCLGFNWNDIIVIGIYMFQFLKISIWYLYVSSAFLIFLVDVSVVLNLSGMRQSENVQVLKPFLETLNVLKFSTYAQSWSSFVSMLHIQSLQTRVFGDNCSSKCPAMYFGPGCTSQCNSTKDQCHPVTGCLQSPSKVHVELFHLIITDTF